MFAADYRKEARDMLYGRWVLAIIAGFVAFLLGAEIFTNVQTKAVFEYSLDEPSWWMGWLPGIILWAVELFLAVFSVFIGIWTLVRVIIGGAATLGYAAFNLDLADRVPTGPGVLFSQFYRLGAGFVMQLLRWLYVFLWSLLFVIPGIMASYSYAMTPYILVENPGMGANEAIRISKQMMYGHRWRLFCLQFSFIGWYIIGSLTFGLGLLAVRPYVEAAQAAFYRDLQRQGMPRM